jgi:hypothetical protein
MSSSIDPTNIDVAYPIAGQDNDSQGFRDNFFNTKSNFTFSKAEIENLQDNVVLKSALTGSTPVNNDMSGETIKSATMLDVRETKVTNATSAGTVTIDIQAGTYHVIPTSTGDITLAFTNLPASGNYIKVIVEFDISATAGVAHTITIPGAPVIGNVQGLSGSTITVGATGRYIYEFSTYNNGTSTIVDNVIPLQNPSQRTIATSKGTAGDVAGMLAFDATFIYTCTADYTTGTIDIWQRTTITTLGAW